MDISESLGRLFGSPARLKLLRLFVFNPTLVIGVDDIIRRSKVVRHTARAELSLLERAGIIKRKQFLEEVPNTTRRRKRQGYVADPLCASLPALRTFLLETAPINSETLKRHLRPLGKIDILVAAGVFMGQFERRLDVLIATKILQPGKVEMAIRNLEAELGVSIRYTAFATQDFLYRVGLYDKLTRDVFDYPYEILIDRVNFSAELRR